MLYSEENSTIMRESGGGKGIIDPGFKDKTVFKTAPASRWRGSILVIGALVLIGAYT